MTKSSRHDPLRLVVQHNLDDGGALRALRAFVTAMESRHEVTWAHLEKTRDPGAMQADAKFIALRRENPFYYLHKATDLWNLREADRAAEKLAATIDEKNFDAVFLHPCRFGQAPSLLRYLKTRSIYYCNEPLRLYREDVPFEDGASRSPWMTMGRTIFGPAARRLNRRDRSLAVRAGLIVTNSAYSRDRIRAVYGRDSVVVPPGVDTERFTPGPRAACRPYLLSVGKLVERKGHYMAVRFVGAFPKESRLPLVVAGFPGSGSFRRRLVSLAAEKGVNLEIRSGPNDAAMANLYRDARLTLALSRREPLGLAALESQSCGTPVVALDEGGHRETVRNGITGILVGDDPANSAAEIRGLLADSSRLLAMGKAGRSAVVEKWGLVPSGERLLAEVERFVHER